MRAGDHSPLPIPHSLKTIALPTWWLWQGCCTRSHSELGREKPLRQWYSVLRRGRVGRCQVCKAIVTETYPLPISNPPISRWAGFACASLLVMESKMAEFFDVDKSIRRLLTLARNGTTTTCKGMSEHHGHGFQNNGIRLIYDHLKVVTQVCEDRELPCLPSLVTTDNHIDHGDGEPFVFFEKYARAAGYNFDDYTEFWKRQRRISSKYARVTERAARLQNCTVLNVR
jgi:hypothetical protein